MARKNENVAALLSMYWESVARDPRGPAPFLRIQATLHTMLSQAKVAAYRRILYEPNKKPIVRPTPPPMRAPILKM